MKSSPNDVGGEREEPPGEVPQMFLRGTSTAMAGWVQTTMANPVRCSRVSNALKSVFLSAVRPSDAASLPGFLVPAYVSCRTTYPPFSKFSTTAAPRSKIGRAPLSIPPEVKFNVTPLQQQQQRMNLSSEVGSRVEIEGPRGKTIVDVPPYICITGSEGGRLQSLTVQNAEERRQREMWGE